MDYFGQANGVNIHKIIQEDQMPTRPNINQLIEHSITGKI